MPYLRLCIRFCALIACLCFACPASAVRGTPVNARPDTNH